MEERKLIITMYNPGDSKVAPRISDEGNIASFELLMAISALAERFANVKPDAFKDKDSEDAALNLFGAAITMGLEKKSEEYAKQIVIGFKKLLVKKFVEKKAKEVMRDAGIDFGNIDDDKEDDEYEG